MATRTVAIGSRVGLHARPASLFTQAVAESGLDVTIAKPGGLAVDASSILMVMAMGVGYGEEVILEADGDNAEEELDKLVKLLATDLDAE
jgi:phosphocarrier protein HPr